MTGHEEHERHWERPDGERRIEAVRQLVDAVGELVCGDDCHPTDDWRHDHDDHRHDHGLDHGHDGGHGARRSRGTAVPGTAVPGTAVPAAVRAVRAVPPAPPARTTAASARR